MVLGIGNSAGIFQRNLQRFIIYYLVRNNEKKMYELTKYLFPNFLRRAKKYGGRTLKSIIYDNIINPKDFQPTTKQLLRLAKNNGLSLYSSYPNIVPAFLSDSAHKDNSNIGNYMNVLSMNDIFGLVHKKDDQKKLSLIDKKISNEVNSINSLTLLINNIGSKKNPTLVEIEKKIKLLDNNNFKNLKFLDTIKNIFTVSDFFYFCKELKRLIKILKTKNIKKLKSFLKKTKILFKGSSGIGMNYYVFYKNK